MMLNDRIWPAMSDAFENSQEDLPKDLLPLWKRLRMPAEILEVNSLHACLL